MSEEASCAGQGALGTTMGITSLPDATIESILAYLGLKDR